MNELEQQLSTILQKAINVAEQTGEFVIEQAPLLLQEFYMWHTASYCFGLIIGILIYLTGRYLPYTWLKNESTGKYSVKFFKKWNVNSDNISKDPSASWIIFVITTVTSSILIGVNIYNLLFIMIAPKLYLIEYFIG